MSAQSETDQSKFAKLIENPYSMLTWWLWIEKWRAQNEMFVYEVIGLKRSLSSNNVWSHYLFQSIALQYNGLDNLDIPDNCFLGIASSLKTLKIGFNSLTIIRRHQLSGLHLLETLWLNNQAIHTVETGKNVCRTMHTITITISSGLWCHEFDCCSSQVIVQPFCLVWASILVAMYKCEGLFVAL